MFGVMLESRDGSETRMVHPAWNRDGTWANRKRAEAFSKSLRVMGRRSWVEALPAVREWVTLVKESDGSGWREAKKWGRKEFFKVESIQVRNEFRRKGKESKSRTKLNNQNTDNIIINTWLSGDLDFNRDLMVALAKTARGIGRSLFVTFGFRTRKEQELLYQKYLNGTGNLAAKPGTSNHESGNAADVVDAKTGESLADLSGARSEAAKHGIVFPVNGEPWHAELG